MGKEPSGGGEEQAAPILEKSVVLGFMALHNTWPGSLSLILPLLNVQDTVSLLSSCKLLSTASFHLPKPVLFRIIRSRASSQFAIGERMFDS